MSTGSSNNSVFISRSNSGFPAYLDFDTMRSDAINYLGPITSTYWTDYNEHDPGITTLEALLYALMDLGYRVNWPIADLLTQGGDDPVETDFFTPAQVLGSNPFTITDYRKKLMDLTEVRNAWLEANTTTVAGAIPLSGLYNVYLELEKAAADFATNAEWAKYQQEVTRAVMGVLQAHRNLCEDFIEPVVMSKQPYTVSADIELAAGASISEVYQAMITALYGFFSPVPHYYTLPQLVAMNVSLDQVFGGRPYDRRPSHGFILDSELPDLPGGGTQSFYRAQVYNILLQVPGISAVRNLNVVAVSSAPAGSAGAGGAGAAAGAGAASVASAPWVLLLNTNTLPVLSVTGSSFRWYSNGQQQRWTPGSTAANLQKTLAYSGKILYPAGSSELDSGVPEGQYLPGLGTYYSIQKDFPEIYGIGPGGLPASASVQRQAQAMQFKAYLLFFEQLMADYLAQLGNIRALLSMSAPVAASTAASETDEDDDPEDMTGQGPGIDPQGGGGSGSSGAMTYYYGDVSDVPDLNDLLLFPPGSGTGTPSATLAYPVDAHKWHELVKGGVVTCAQVEALTPYTFVSSHQRDLAVAELTLSFTVMPPVPSYQVLEGGKVVFVIAGVRRDFVLLGSSLADNLTDASGWAATALYAGASKDYYSLGVQTVGDGDMVRYTFSLGQSDLDYYDYISTLLADPVQNVQRRTEFLQHLITRFAESYTDYASLSTGFLGSQAIADNQVGLMEQFLSNLPMLGADRCRAFNQTRPGWDSTNVSGFELRFKAYCGIPDWRRHYLCPFEVVTADRQYRLRPALAGEEFMSTPASFTEAEGYAAAGDLYERMKSAAHYRVVQRGMRYKIAVDLHAGDVVESVMDWATEGEAAAAIGQLELLWRLSPMDADIRVNQAEYRAEVVDADGRVVRIGRSTYADEATALEDAGKKIHDIHEAKFWQITAGAEHVPGRLERNREKESHLYMDTKGLEMPIKHDIPHKPEHCRFVVSDKAAGFSFASVDQFPTASAGRAGSRAFLFLLIEAANYTVKQDAESRQYRLNVGTGERVLATERTAYPTEEEARVRMDVIIRLLRQRLYTLRLIRTPLSWKFDVYLGLPGGRTYLFRSADVYPGEEEARATAVDFYQADTGWELRKEGKAWLLEKSGGGRNTTVCVLEVQEGQPTGKELEKELQQAVVAKSSVLALEQGNRETLGSWLQADEQFKEGGYIYRLVDKDRPRAFHIVSGEDRSRAAAEAVRTALIARGRRGYLFPEFCLGGDNVYYKQDATGAGAYHFRIRCRNDYFYWLGLQDPDKEWTLFESIAGYPTEDAAQQAFQDSYLDILEKAGVHVNYGEKDYIAWDEHGRRLAIVYVSAELRSALERAGLNVADVLVKACRAYPIRRKGTHFFFELLNEDREEPDWLSAGRFATAQDAHTAFDYFRLLLNMAANYFIDYDEKDCRYRVGIREVLAESTGAFATEEEAWGPEGIERFIGVAQSKGGFHPEKRLGVGWGYFVACRNQKAVHPCSYEAESQRDAALDQLYTASQGFPVAGWFRDEAEKGVGLPNVENGHPVAVIPEQGIGEAAPGEVLLNLALDVLDAVWAGLFYEDGEGLYIKAGGGSLLVRPGSIASRDRWEDELLRYGAYFPIVRTQSLGVATQYRVEIKLPGFVALPGRSHVDKACGCPPGVAGQEPTCYAAWVSPIVYGTAVEAWAAYSALLPLLADKGNYKPVHDEAALFYGIELLEEDQILAHSVQPYFYAKMAARALDRAEACINAEGLNVVEHLLLRNEAGAQEGIPVCPPNTDTSLGFQPGADPYSFVMTVFLPAWPQRFRKTENRQLLESILQREAPAHILPRILWLTPRDMCRVESSYKKWLRWLRKKDRCGDFQPEELIKLLFDTSFACMEDAGCCPGSGGAKATSDDWLSAVNLLYCWKDQACADTSGWKTGGGDGSSSDGPHFDMGGTKLEVPPLKWPKKDKPKTDLREMAIQMSEKKQKVVAPKEPPPQEQATQEEVQQPEPTPPQIEELRQVERQIIALLRRLEQTLGRLFRRSKTPKS